MEVQHGRELGVLLRGPGLHDTISPCFFSLDVEQVRPGVTSELESWCKSLYIPDGEIQQEG